MITRLFFPFSSSNGRDVYVNRREMRKAGEGGRRGECECEKYIVLNCVCTMCAGVGLKRVSVTHLIRLLDFKK